MAEPEPPQQGADAALGQMYAEAGLDHLRQVDPAPADHAVLGQIGTGADQRRQLGLMLRRQAGLGAPGGLRSDSPAKPSWLKRWTQPRKV